LYKLDIQQLQAGYGHLIVISDVSLSVEKGTLTCIVGPNGSGKSTLIKAIFSMSNVFSGKIFIDGDDVTQKGARNTLRKGLAYVPQVRNVFGSMTVEENWNVAANAAKNIKADDDLERAFSLFPKLPDRRKQKASTLSGGERQMVAAGMGIMAGANTLIMDEPTAGLAIRVAKHLLADFKKLTKEGFTIVIVEQNVRTGLEVADNALVLVSGRTAYSGDAGVLLREKDLGRLFMGTD
jgi:branched-chain amino acid transport system ATP-binding protein